MTIELTQEQEQLIDRALASGHFSDRREVITKALALLNRQAEARATVQAAVQRGLDDLDAGRYRTISTSEEAQTLAAEIKQRARELRAQREHSAH